MELFDLYNADRKPIEGTMIRGQSQPENTFRLVVHCCVFNFDGHMLIQRRQDFKEGWSGMWDITCGGSAISSENSQKAIERELFEELGIKNDFSDVRPILTIHFDKGFDDVYTVNHDININDLTLQKEEVAEVKWATEEEILNMIKDGIFIPYHEHLIGLLFFMRNKRGAFKND